MLESSSFRRSEAETEVLPKNISFGDDDKFGMGSSRSLNVFGMRLIIELCLEYLSEGLKKDWKSVFCEVGA